ncbi:MAG: hemerythrin domain-containing protein [Ectothiorhodospiraceae bacterium]|nr:hemerythrin domain-containing protein [Chromatiales bacterium]MCP5153788.1 hemerythrin domain-containing protein [Ectothiorhodospiraceae bacterium]
MPEILDDLRTDHRNIAHLLDLLEREIDAVERIRDADFELMRDIMHYMTHYPDHTHHPKEDLMFERLRARSARAPAVVEQLRREHQGLATKGRALLEVLSRVVDGGIVERTELAGAARDYAGFLRHHMRVEDGEAFPLAESTLHDEDWAAVARAFERRGDPVFGPVVAEEYRDLLAHIDRAAS